MTEEELKETDAKISLRFKQGRSFLRWEGKTYAFDHRNEKTNLEPVHWQYSYEVRSGQGSQEGRSPDETSLIRVLVGKEGKPELLYFRPGILGDLAVQMEVNAPSDVSLRVEGLELDVTYDSYTASHRVLDVSQAGCDGVYISVSASDLGGRADGRGHFKRFYPVGQRVELRAPLEFGRKRFREWQGADGKALSNRPWLEVSMDDHRGIRALYTGR
jgi:hypothetical protein